MATLLFGSFMAPKTALLPEVVVQAAVQVVNQCLKVETTVGDDLTPGASVAGSLDEDKLRSSSTSTDTVDGSLHLNRCYSASNYNMGACAPGLDVPS